MHDCFSKSCPCVVDIKIIILKEGEAISEDGTDARFSQLAGSSVTWLVETELYDRQQEPKVTKINEHLYFTY